MVWVVKKEGKKLRVVRDDNLVTSEVNIILEWIQSQQEVAKHELVVLALHQINDKSPNQIAFSLNVTFIQSSIKAIRYYVVNVVSNQKWLGCEEYRLLLLLSIL